MFELKKKGGGLGLVIAKLIVEKFGGDIVIKSQEGHGSNVEFKFALEKNSLEFIDGNDNSKEFKVD